MKHHRPHINNFSTKFNEMVDRMTLVRTVCQEQETATILRLLYRWVDAYIIYSTDCMLQTACYGNE